MLRCPVTTAAAYGNPPGAWHERTDVTQGSLRPGHHRNLPGHPDWRARAKGCARGPGGGGDTRRSVHEARSNRRGAAAGSPRQRSQRPRRHDREPHLEPLAWIGEPSIRWGLHLHSQRPLRGNRRLRLSTLWVVGELDHRDDHHHECSSRGRRRLVWGHRRGCPAGPGSRGSR